MLNIAAHFVHCIAHYIFILVPFSSAAYKQLDLCRVNTSACFWLTNSVQQSDVARLVDSTCVLQFLSPDICDTVLHKRPSNIL
jgi:hypothetical protein